MQGKILLDRPAKCMCIHIQEAGSLFDQTTYQGVAIRRPKSCGELSTKGVKSINMKKIQTVRDLKGEVYKILRTGIVNGDLAPGTRLKETDLVRDLAVSRTPIREALNQLSKEGLVEIIPRKGTFVKQWNKDEALEILLIREALESLAARLATARMGEEQLTRLEGYMDSYGRGELGYTEADRMFHNEIVQACGMGRLVDMIQNLYDTLRMNKILGVSFESPDRIRESLVEHKNIIRALRERNGEEVERLMKLNFQHTRGFLDKVF